MQYVTNSNKKSNPLHFCLLHFQAKVTFVRDDDNEYDVQYEDGTVFTLKAKEVKAVDKVVSKTDRRKASSPSRSRSRGRSPGRPKATPSAKKATPAAAAPRSTSRGRPTAASKATAAAARDSTPIRTSARIAASKVNIV